MKNHAHSGGRRRPLTLIPWLPMLRHLSLFLVLTAAPASAAIDFAHQIVPILKEHCAKCHLGEARKGGFSMNTRELLLAGSENGPVVAAAEKEPGTLWQVLVTDDEDTQMPPEGPRVPPQQLALLKAWIEEGLPWEDGFSFGAATYEPPLKPRQPELPPAVEGREHPVDRLIDAYFAKHGLTRPRPLSDAAFIRRLSLDLIGLLPTPEEIAAFVADTAPDKRERLISTTLEKKTAYTEHWLSFWNDLLRNDYVGTGYIDGGRRQITRWLYQALHENLPYDRFARELLAPPTEESAGFINGIKWRGSVNASQEREIQFSQSISQTFLGLNMKCASCHDSFVDRWKLDEAYGLAAIFAEGPLEIARCDKPTGRLAQASWIFPELGQIDAGAERGERLRQLANLMTHPENGRFTRTLVNRLWHRLMGRGIVHPVDAMDTAPWNEDLLDYLAVRFAEDGYDLKKALAFLASSQLYQSECVPVKENESPYVFRGPIEKRLTAEQFVDAVWALTGTAPALPDPNIQRGPRHEVPLQGQWIWSYAEASSSAPAGETVVFATEVELPELPRSAVAALSCDNEAEVFINGQPAAHSTDWQRVAPAALEGFRAGRNLIHIIAKNGGHSANPAGLFFEAHVTFPNAPTTLIATNGTWKWDAQPPEPGSSLAHWKPAVAVKNQQTWQTVASVLKAALAPASAEMVRASLVPSDLLMRALGRPNREQIVSMRPEVMTTLEAIDLANGEQLSNLLKEGAKKLIAQHSTIPSLMEDLYVRALSRRPTTAETAALTDALGSEATATNVEDVLWLVLMQPEFQYVR